MSPLTMIRKILSPLIFLNIVERYREKSSLIKIRAAELYVKGIGKLRIFYLGSFFVLIALILLISGWVLIHLALFVYSALNVQAKLVLALLLGGVEFLGASVILFYVFREETWVKFTEINTVLNAVIEGDKKEADNDNKNFSK